MMSKTSNAWGLYDVCGNVWEWVQDKYNRDLPGHKNSQDPLHEDSGSPRVVRGGAGTSYFPRYLRSALRYYDRPRSSVLRLGVSSCEDIMTL